MSIRIGIMGSGEIAREDERGEYTGLIKNWKKQQRKIPGTKSKKLILCKPNGSCFWGNGINFMKYIKQSFKSAL